MNDVLLEAAARLGSADRVVALTGAGVSAESGLATFRDAMTGLWARYRAEDLATPAAFERDPELVWSWYAWRRRQAAEARPNAGHFALAELERLAPRFRLVTQNVDGLHQRAGSMRVLELHGNLHRVKCSREQVPVEDWDASEPLPRCPRCGAPLRPDVVWFGESLPAGSLEDAGREAAVADAFLVAGTSAVVEPAASLAAHAAARGATVIVVNAEPPRRAYHGQLLLLGRSGEVLPELLRAAYPARKTIEPPETEVALPLTTQRSRRSPT